MDQLSAGSGEHTTLGNCENFISCLPHREKCDVCRSPAYYDGVMIPPEDYVECTCDDSGETRYVAIMVKARGKPIPKKPAETIYVITIWDLTLPTRDECGSFILYYTDATYEFIIDVADRPEDLDFSNKEQLNKYQGALSNLIQSKASFKAQTSRENYIKDFRERIETIIRTEERPQKVSEENAHITRRKKGHSHVR